MALPQAGAVQVIESCDSPTGCELIIERTGRGLDTSEGKHEDTIKALIIDKYINRITDEEICERYKISRNTIYNWLKTPEALEIRFNVIPQAYKRSLATKLGFLAEKAIKKANDRLNNDKGSLGEINALMGTSIDKLNVLTGSASEIIEHRHLDGNKILDIINGRASK